MRTTAIYRDKLFLEHQPGFGHPESPERLQVIYDALEQLPPSPWRVYPEFEPASPEILTLNHTSSLIQRVEASQHRTHDMLDPDTHTSPHSHAAACLAAGSLIDGVKRIFRGECSNALCLVRPPGHHAEEDQAKGFCLFNNVALAARWALQHFTLDKILIVDWDLHHGNGTQNSFYDTNKVLYFSSHQYPYYPGTGAVIETGRGLGQGHTINVPLSGGQGDLEYARIFNELVLPLARAYQPELILVSCGFDIYAGDPLGMMKVSPAGFAWMTRVLCEAAEELCHGRLLVTLEGGYNLKAMRDGTLAVLAELCGDLNKSPLSAAQAAAFARADLACPALDQAMQVAQAYWNF
jgi:acetoin utilization deacetylase AcuC-like enzyme